MARDGESVAAGTTDAGEHTGTSGSAASVRILFVDDEVKVLDGLRRMLRSMRHEWDMTFVEDPHNAADLLAARDFDAIVVDMRMPRMSGSELLRIARERKPGMARIVLSGHAEKEAALRSVGLAHQFLAKPCDADKIRATVARTCALRRVLSDAGLADVVCQLGALPSLPALYRAVTEEMTREDASLKRIAELIGRDLAMTAKVLQLVNSAFFGLGRNVSSIEEAVSYLGVEVIRSLIVSNEAFAAFEAADIRYFEDLWRHGSLTGALAHTIARELSNESALHGEALQAGLLHDIGSLVLAARLPERHRMLREMRAEPNRSALERELLGCDHGRIGAHLLGLWGLSDRIVEAIAYHDMPSECPYRQFSPLTAVHAASRLVDEALGVTPAAELDTSYLETVSCAQHVDHWRATAANLMHAGMSP